MVNPKLHLIASQFFINGNSVVWPILNLARDIMTGFTQSFIY